MTEPTDHHKMLAKIFREESLIAKYTDNPRVQWEAIEGMADEAITQLRGDIEERLTTLKKGRKSEDDWTRINLLQSILDVADSALSNRISRRVRVKEVENIADQAARRTVAQLYKPDEQQATLSRGRVESAMADACYEAIEAWIALGLAKGE